MFRLPVNIESSYPDATAEPSILMHLRHHDLIHAAVNNQVSKGDLAFDLRDQPGVVGDGVADDTAALQAALDAGVTFGARIYANGTFKTTGTLQITSNADLIDATILYKGTGAAVNVGASGTYSQRKTVRLPQVIASSKTVNGWGEVAGSVGVVVQNCYSLDLTVPRVKNFETGLTIAGFGNGTSYCNITLGHLENNKRNLRFTADATGWANQNNFYGGRLSHYSNEGTAVPGTRHILIDNATASKVNNNSFWGTSIESPNVVEYHLDCAGNDNYWTNCRWENTGTGARVIWRTKSTGNVIGYGYGSQEIVETKEVLTANILLTRARSRMVGDGGTARNAVLSLENIYSSSSAALRIMGAGAEGSRANQNTSWAVDISSSNMRGKRPADARERINVDFLNGRVYVGAGFVAATRYFGNVGSAMGFDGSSVCFATDNKYDIGMTSRRPRYVRAGTGVQTGAFATRSRPAASTAGVGTSIFDTTLKKPIWSTGSVWVDAMGKAT